MRDEFRTVQVSRRSMCRHPLLNQKAMAEPCDRCRETGLCEQARLRVLPLADIAKAGELHEPSPFCRVREEFSPFESPICWRPGMLVAGGGAPPGAAGDIFERSFERADKVAHPGRKPM